MRNKNHPIDVIFYVWDVAIELIVAFICIIIAAFARYKDKKFDIGIGPEPIINNIYHKKSLEKVGYSARTFVDHTYIITNKFDYIFAPRPGDMGIFIKKINMALHVLTNYKSIYIYFNGCIFMNTRFIWMLEPFVLNIARVKTVVTAYGSDVQTMIRCQNLLFRHSMSVDYSRNFLRKKRVEAQIDLWTRYADHIVAYCDAPDYLYHWDTLLPSFLSIDTEVVRPKRDYNICEDNIPLRLLHAPNHQSIKGTEHIVRAVAELKEEGIPIELQIIQFSSNEQVLDAMCDADVVVDQLIIGWHGMFAVEAMTMGKPVVCYLRPDLIKLYVGASVLDPEEIPIISADPVTIKDVLRKISGMSKKEISEIGIKSQKYVKNHHSLHAIGSVLSEINEKIGILPRNKI